MDGKLNLKDKLIVAVVSLSFTISLFSYEYFSAKSYNQLQDIWMHTKSARIYHNDNVKNIMEDSYWSIKTKLGLNYVHPKDMWKKEKYLIKNLEDNL